MERGEFRISRTDDGWQTNAHGLVGLLVRGAFVLICLGMVALWLSDLLG